MGGIEDISLAKAGLTAEDLQRNADRTTIRQTIKPNLEDLLQASFVQERKGIFRDGDAGHLFSHDGSLILRDFDDLPDEVKGFFQKEGRALQTANGLEARGARYLIAIDPNISVPQKLQIYREDFADGIDALRAIQIDSTEQHRTISPILDYIKNAAVTLLNAYIQEEKIGNFRLDDSDYQQRRSALISLTRATTKAFYGSLLDEVTPEQMQDLFDESTGDLISSVCVELTQDFKDYTFSSNYLVRPESSHPLTNLAAAYITSERYAQTDTVIGFPSGSTELACLAAEALEYWDPEKQVDLILLPFSLHSSKKQFRGQKSVDAERAIEQKIKFNKTIIQGKNILLLDDNSSTGRTMQRAAEIIKELGQPGSLEVAVAESDIIRSELDLDDPKRTHIANPLLYRDSVGILPVSRRLRPKHNLREIMEEKKLARYYKKKAEEALTIEERIKYEVFADGAERPMYLFYDKHGEDEFIGSFHGTFLSNFYAVSVEIAGVPFPSVEHAYQSAKFTPVAIRSLPPEKQEEIREYLREKGYGREIADLSTIFTDNTITSGIIKVVADRLRESGILADDWDERRVDTMTGLLVQKFRHPILAKRLLDTGDKILVEGNDWDDTFWGVDTNSRKGRNILGRLLMNIREKLQTGGFESIESLGN